MTIASSMSADRKVKEFAVELGELKRTAPNSVDVSGQVWLSLAGHPFPGMGWWDSAAVVLTWWAEATTRLVELGEASDLLFMEGPFAAELTPLPAGGVQVRGTERTSRGSRPRAETITSESTLLAEMRSACNRVLAFCSDQGVESDDVRLLRAAASRLRE